MGFVKTLPSEINENAKLSKKSALVNDDFQLENSHMGVAVPLTSEDLDREMTAMSSSQHSTTTSKEGISTWILLSGGTPTKEPRIKEPARVDIKVDKISVATNITQTTTKKPIRRTTMKPKLRTTTVASGIDSVTVKEEKSTQNPTRVTVSPITRRKTVVETRPVLVTKKPSKKIPISTSATIRTTKMPTSSTTVAPSTTTTLATTTSSKASTTEAPLATDSSPSSIETTTFLILEPKDADFDLPQDRSPGHTTKSPKRKNSNKTKTKKNKTKVAPNDKKPGKGPAAKDKPLTTKIYNYLAREVMPTVGVGLVGLAVTAGLATYFLSPFGALRRSYDVADRKDDMYFYNNEEYAGPDGQSEEEIFGKVIAGMPVNSPYRNSIKYTPNRPNNPQQVQYRNGPPHDGMYPPPQYRYRNNGPGPGYQEHGPPQVYKKPPPQSPYQQKYYRYNNDASMYRTNMQNASPMPPQAPSPSFSNTNLDQNDNSNTFINKAEDQITEGPSQAPDVMFEDSNLLKRRSQFVVGSVQNADTNENVQASSNEQQQQPVVETIPEHGPRRRRNTLEFREFENEITDSDNEVDNNVEGDKVEKTTAATTTTSSVQPSDQEKVTESSLNNITTTQSIPPYGNGNSQQTIFELLRNIFEIKVRTGLSFLQNTTMAFQRYLKAVEKRVEQSKLFSKRQ